MPRACGQDSTAVKSLSRLSRGRDGLLTRPRAFGSAKRAHLPTSALIPWVCPVTHLAHSAQVPGVGHPPNLLRKLRWFLLFVFAAAMVVVFFRQAVASANPGWDFEHFYAGAQIVRAGLGHSLYDISVQHEFETRFAHGRGGVFNYPATTVLLFLPL